MPKFLDAPQWYTSNGTLIDMGTPGTAVAGKYFGTTSTGVLGWQNNQFTSVNGVVPTGANIYAPTSRGDDNSVCVWNGNNGRPDWIEPGSNPAVLAYSASAENTTWLAPDSSNNQVLKNGGNGALIWAGPINRYLHNINVDCTVSNVTYHCIFQLILSYQQEINTFLLLCQQMNTYYGTNNYIPCVGYSGSGRSNANTLFSVRASSAGALLISYIIDGGSGGVSSVTASSGTVKDKTILISSTY